MKRAGAGPGLLRRVTSVRWLRVPAEKVHFPHNLFHGVGPGAMRRLPWPSPADPPRLHLCVPCPWFHMLDSASISTRKLVPAEETLSSTP